MVKMIYESPQKMNQQSKPEQEDKDIQASAGGATKKKNKKPQQQ